MVAFVLLEFWHLPKCWFIGFFNTLLFELEKYWKSTENMPFWENRVSKYFKNVLGKCQQYLPFCCMLSKTIICINSYFKEFLILKSSYKTCIVQKYFSLNILYDVSNSVFPKIAAKTVKCVSLWQSSFRALVFVFVVCESSFREKLHPTWS